MANIDRRKFLKLTATAAAATAVSNTYAAPKSGAKAKVVVIGAGAAGIDISARLLRMLESPDITIIDPAETHYYQPGFTLIAGGVYKPDEVYKPQKDCIPDGAKWVKDSVAAVDPDAKTVATLGGQKIGYDFLVLTPGLVLRWDLIDGIDEKSLGVGNAH